MEQMSQIMLYYHLGALLRFSRDPNWVGLHNICDHVWIKGSLVGKCKTEISAVKVNWSILLFFREYANQILFYIRKQ